MSHPAFSGRALRFPVAVPVRYRHALAERGASSSGFTHDLSVSGAAMDLSEQLPIRSWMSLQLQLGAASMALNAGVLWVRQPMQDRPVFRHGVAFGPLETPGAQLLAQFLQAQTVAPTRVSCGRRVTALVQATIEARVLDLSPLGACLEHRGRLRAYMVCHLTLCMPTRVLDLHGRILRSQIVRVDAQDNELIYHTGVQFEQVTAGQAQDLRSIIAECQ